MHCLYYNQSSNGFISRVVYVSLAKFRLFSTVQRITNTPTPPPHPPPPPTSSPIPHGIRIRFAIRVWARLTKWQCVPGCLPADTLMGERSNMGNCPFAWPMGEVENAWKMGEIGGPARGGRGIWWRTIGTSFVAVNCRGAGNGVTHWRNQGPPPRRELCVLNGFLRIPLSHIRSVSFFFVERAKAINAPMCWSHKIMFPIIFNRVILESEFGLLLSRRSFAEKMNHKIET